MVSVGCGAGVHRDIVAASDEEYGRNWEREEEETVHGSPTNLARTQTGIRLSRDVIGHCSRSGRASSNLPTDLSALIHGRAQVARDGRANTYIQ